MKCHPTTSTRIPQRQPGKLRRFITANPCVMYLCIRSFFLYWSWRSPSSTLCFIAAAHSKLAPRRKEWRQMANPRSRTVRLLEQRLDEIRRPRRYLRTVSDVVGHFFICISIRPFKFSIPLLRLLFHSFIHSFISFVYSNYIIVIHYLHSYQIFFFPHRFINYWWNIYNK